MTKIEKCLAKLYFALGEENARSGKNVEITAFMVEYLSFLALHQFDSAAASRFFMMGASSARRAITKPPRGHSCKSFRNASSLPPKGKKIDNKVKISKRVKKVYDEWSKEDFEDED